MNDYIIEEESVNQTAGSIADGYSYLVIIQNCY